jgi:adenosyl cobinamide kinase/adenosyl cobinamide phosphate guanylyltransferase
VSLVVLLGGARSGKSALAQRLAGEEATLIATAAALDSEMEERIRRHRAERPSGWTTVEETIELGTALANVGPQSSVVVDCLSLWVANLLRSGVGADGAVEATAGSVAGSRQAVPGLTVAVSNEVRDGHRAESQSSAGATATCSPKVQRESWVEAADRALLASPGRRFRLSTPDSRGRGAGALDAKTKPRGSLRPAGGPRRPHRRDPRHAHPGGCGPASA